MSSLVRRVGGGLGRNFWTLLSASFLANLFDGIFWIALPLLAVGLTDSPALVALRGGLVGPSFGLPAVFIFAAVVHALLLPSRLILNGAFMTEVEEQAQANAVASQQAG